MRYFLALLLLSQFSIGQTKLSFSNKPWNDPEMNAPGRGAQYWNGTDWDNTRAPQVPTGSATPEAKNLYWRYWWNELEASEGVYNFTKASMGSKFWKSPEWHLEWCANTGALYSMGGIMTAWDYPGNIFYDGAWAVYPEYLHKLMQAEPRYKDWKYNAQNCWVPNWNSKAYLERFRVMNDTLLKFIRNWKFIPKTGPMAGKLVEGYKMIDFIDLRGYGNYGEWHTWPWAANDGGPEPEWGKATDSTLKKIIDIGADIWGDYPLHIPVGVFDDNRWGEGTAFSAYWAMNRKTRYGMIGWRRDNLGDPGLDDFLMGNTFMYNGWRADTAILARWRYAMITGEPINGGSSYDINNKPYGDLRREIQQYHVAGFGNGNYPSADIAKTSVRDSLNEAFKITGYRLNINGGAISSNLFTNTPFNITLRWRNAGAAPLYQKRWKVKFQLRSSTDLLLQEWASAFNPYLFLPSAADSLVSQNFVIGDIPAGINYKLVLIVEDTTGYLPPLPLALKSPARNADGSYTLRTKLTLAKGSAPVQNNLERWVARDEKKKAPTSRKVQQSNQRQEDDFWDFQWLMKYFH